MHFQTSAADCIGGCENQNLQSSTSSSVNFLPSLQFQHFGVEHGLSNISIGEQSILRDKQGFLWVSTQDGLNRYDGHQFKHFFHDPNNDNSISNNIANALYEDFDGLIWIGTWGGGINSFDPITEQFTHYRGDTKNNAIFGNDHIFAITQDKSGNIWAATQDGLIIKRNQENKFLHYSRTIQGKPTLISNDIRVLHYSSDNNLWIGTRDKGVIRIDLNNNKHFNYTENSATEKKVNHNDIQDIYEDKNSDIWISTSSGLNKFDSSTQRMQRPLASLKSHPLNSGLVRKLVDDASGNLWITTLSGLYHLDINSYSIKKFRHDPSDSNSLSSHDVNTIYRDNEGNIWLGFQEKGLDRFHPAQQLFNFHKSYEQSTLFSNNLPVNALLLDHDDNLWIGTPGNGLYRKHGRASSNAVVQYHSKSANFSDDQVSRMLQDSKNRIWVGTLGGGLNYYDNHTDSFINFSFDNRISRSLSNNYVYSIAEDNAGTLWIGTSQGLNKLGADGQSFSHFFTRNSKPYTGKDQSIRSIVADSSNNLWLGTQDGLIYFDTQTHEYRQYVNIKERANSISNNWIVSLHYDAQELLWIGTAGGGLNVYNSKNKVFQRFGLDEGLPSGIIYDIFQDAAGIIWLSTANGLVSFDYKNRIFTRFTTQHGLQDNNFNSGAFQSTKDELFFGGPKGYNRFFPDKIKSHRYKENSQIVLTDFLLFNRSVPVKPRNKKNDTQFSLSHSIFNTEKIQLNYKHNLFGFEFSNLNFNDSINGFNYRLKGWDESWVTTDSSKLYATYTNIPSGEYIFQVKPISISNQNSEKITSIKIGIKAAPWKTAWAYSIYLILAMLVFWLFFWLILRKKSADEKSRLATEIAATKEQLLANVSHEFRTPLTLILGPVRSLIDSNNDENSLKLLNQIEGNGKRLLSMVEQLLDIAKITWSRDYNLSPISIVAACRSITNSFQAVAKENDITLVFFTSTETDCWVEISNENLETLLINLLSNAIKYTPPEGKIEVSVAAISDLVEVSVMDTGYGIEKRDQQRIFERFTRMNNTQHIASGAGIGLSLVETIVKRMNGTISVTSELNKGSVFKIKLPRCETSSVDEIKSKYAASTSLTHSIEQLKSSLDTTNFNEDTPSSVDSSHRLNPPCSFIEKPNILVVEDNFEMRRYIYDSLKDNFRILEASNGEQGFSLAKLECPDLIIADVMMPHLDGFDLLKIIRRELITSHIPVILLTAKGDQQSRLKGLSALADDYITKPFDPNELETRIRNLLSIREILKERFRHVVMSNIKYQPSDSYAINETPRNESIDKAFSEHELAERGFSDKEHAFYLQFEKCIAKRYSQTDLVLSIIATELAMSDRQLQRKLNALGLGFSEYLKSYRLEQAIKLLQNQEKVSNVVEQVGFNSNTYFARCFKAKYGCSPSQYRDRNNVSIP